MRFTKRISLSGRVEYFNDENQVQIVNMVNPLAGFQTFSSGDQILRRIRSVCQVAYNRKVIQIPNIDKPAKPL